MNEEKRDTEYIYIEIIQASRGPEVYNALASRFVNRTMQLVQKRAEHWKNPKNK